MMTNLPRLMISMTIVVMLQGCGPRNGVTERNRTHEPGRAKITRLAEPPGPLTLTLGEPIRVRLDNRTLIGKFNLPVQTFCLSGGLPGEQFHRQPFGKLDRTAI